MCILFLSISKRPSPGSYKLILASNRDESFARPTDPAQFWPNHLDIIGGRDMEPGKEGGTWLAMKKNGKIGTLLNIFTDVPVTSDKLGRGFLVNDFLTNEHLSGIQYAKELQAKAALYNPFNFVTIELKNPGGPSLTYYSSKSADGEPIQFQINRNNELYAFGNSQYHLPFQKVLDGKRKMEEVVKLLGTKQHEEELITEILNILKCRHRFSPDPQMQKQAPSYNESMIEPLTSKFVCVPSHGYGSRTHTIILVDEENHVQFMEWTMEGPMDCENTKWKHSKFEFELQ